MENDDYRESLSFRPWQNVRLPPILHPNLNSIQTSETNTAFCSRSEIQETNTSVKSLSKLKTEHQPCRGNTISINGRPKQVVVAKLKKKQPTVLPAKQTVVINQRATLPRSFPSLVHTAQSIYGLDDDQKAITNRKLLKSKSFNIVTERPHAPANTQDELLPNIQVQSFSRTSPSAQPSQRYLASKSTTRLLHLRKPSATNSTYLGAQCSPFNEETIFVPLNETGEKQFLFESTKSRARPVQRRVAVVSYDDKEHIPTRRVGICSATDTTRRERQLARVLNKRL